MVAEAMDFKGDLVVSFVNQYIVESIGGFYGSYLTKKEIVHLAYLVKASSHWPYSATVI